MGRPAGRCVAHEIRVILQAVADLEKHAIKRDKRFLIRLVLLLGIAGLAGLFIYGKMTSEEFANCAAGGFGEATGAPAPGNPAGGEAASE